jgi:haloalkane dehalogenase
MKFARTPDDRFANLPDWNYEPIYTQVDAQDGSGDTLRVAHYEAGPTNAKETVLCMHGEPSWSFLYRKMAKSFSDAGHRVVMPDLIGFGRSDKPLETKDFTYERHVAWMSEWLSKNNFNNLTLMCQDWGGLIGLRLVTAFPDRFSRVVVSNTGLPVAGREPTEAFRAWQKFSQSVPVFEVGKLVNGGALNSLTEAEVAAYDAPFPDETYKAGARIFPSLYPDGLDDPSHLANVKAWDVLHQWTKPFLCAFGDSDPITKGGDRGFIPHVPGAKDQPHTIIEGGSHFIQENRGRELAAVINSFISSTPSR